MKYRRANKPTTSLFFTLRSPTPLDTSSLSAITPLIHAICASTPNIGEYDVILDNESSANNVYVNQIVVYFDSADIASDIKAASRLDHFIQYVQSLNAADDTVTIDRKTVSINTSYATKIQEVSASVEIENCEFDVQIPGLHLIRDFISAEEEEQILQTIEKSVVYDERIKMRQVKHYGFEFDYNTRKVNPKKSIEKLPEWANSIADKISTQCSVSVPDQLTINEYLPGQGIKPHTDTHSPFEDFICSLSLRSDIVMNFVNPETDEKKFLLLPQRSLLVMTGESRYLWRHGIHCRKQDRVDNKLVNRRKRLSLTFRKVRIDPNAAQNEEEIVTFPPCKCSWPKYCDSQSEEYVPLPYKTDVKPTVLENEYVVKFYDAVAKHWDSTRHSPWPAVNRFIMEQPQHSLFADVGCGNGKYIKYILEHNCYYVASDRSEKLVEICSHKYGYDVAVADATSLPYRSDQFDAVINVAVMHHISSEARRLQLLKELVRITKPGGQLLVTAWALEQGAIEKRRFKQQDTMVPWHFQTRFTESEQEEESEATALKKPTEEVVFQRYCHVYAQGELDELFARIDGIKIMSSELERGNWNLRVMKLL